jgi:hypothetical protein
MTDFELLARIDELERFSEWTHDLGDLRYAQSIPHTQQVMLKALRAVVEFHRPIEIKDMMIYCQGCSNSALFAWDSCPTIQAIKRELG